MISSLRRSLLFVMKYKEEIKEEIFENIILDIAENKKPTRRAVIDGGMSLSTFFAILDNSNEHSKRYARACQIRAESIEAEMLDICDMTEDDVITLSDGKQVTNHNVINRDRLRVDTRKWLLAKLHPKRYADKVDVTTDGEKINNNLDYSKLSTETILKIQQELKEAENKEK